MELAAPAKGHRASVRESDCNSHWDPERSRTNLKVWFHCLKAYEFLKTNR